MSLFDDIGDAFSQAAHAVADVARGAADAAQTAVHTVTNAAENLVDPHLSELRQEYDAAVNRYNNTRVQVLDARDQFAAALGRLRDYVACNAALLIALQGARWTDAMFDDYLKATATPPAGLSPDRVLPQEIAETLTEATGDSHVANAIYGLGDLLRMPIGGGLAPLAGSVAQAALGALPLPPTVASALQAVIAPIEDIASIAPPSLITLALDIAAKEIGYRRSIDAVQGQTRELDAHIAQIQASAAGAAAQVITEKRAFLAAMGRLAAIDAPNFRWQLAEQEGDAAWLAAMEAAMRQYGVLLALRGDWERMRAANPQLDFRTFIEFETLRRDAHRYSPQQVVQFVGYLAASSESLRQAWLASPWANRRQAA